MRSNGAESLQGCGRQSVGGREGGAGGTASLLPSSFREASRSELFTGDAKERLEDRRNQTVNAPGPPTHSLDAGPSLGWDSCPHGMWTDLTF